MAGSIIQLEKGRKSRCGKWRLQAPAGRDPKTGKYRKITETFRGTYSEAEARLAEMVGDIRANASVESSGMEFREFAAQWLEREKANATAAARTTEKYGTHINALNVVLGRARLQDLTPWDIEDAYAKLRSGDSPSGKRLSGTYVSCIHSTLRTILDEAVRRRLIRHNPANDAKPPKNDTEERDALSSRELLELIDRLDKRNRNHVAVMLCCMMGLRRGEVVALNWEDVDFGERVINVRKSYDDMGNLKTPKTRAGVRTVPMPDAVVDALITLHGSSCRYSALFCDEFGNRMKPHSLTTWWRRNRASLGYEGVTLHDLRHTFASHMARSGVGVKVTQKLCGHANASTTLNIYSHVDLEDKRAAVNMAF